METHSKPFKKPFHKGKQSRQRKPKGQPITGWIVLDKPLHMTSAQAVAYIKRIFDAQKAGHGGTLDPLATGVLPIALGEATKTMNYVLDADKHYRFDVTFGEERATDDAEGDIVQQSDTRPTQDDIEDALVHFMGDIEQLPPTFSAVKIKGRAAYDMARKGEDVKLDPKKITVHTLKLEAFDGHTATFFIHASKGTYVRSIARDLGRMLGCYGYVSKLERTKAGRFTFEQTITKEKLDECLKNEQSAPDASEKLSTEAIKTLLRPADAVLDDIPAYRASPAEERALKAGKLLVRVHLKPGLMRVKTQDDRLISLVEIGQAGEFKVMRNFNV